MYCYNLLFNVKKQRHKGQCEDQETNDSRVSVLCGLEHLLFTHFWHKPFCQHYMFHWAALKCFKWCLVGQYAPVIIGCEKKVFWTNKNKTRTARKRPGLYARFEKMLSDTIILNYSLILCFFYFTLCVKKNMPGRLAHITVGYPSNKILLFIAQVLGSAHVIIFWLNPKGKANLI